MPISNLLDNNRRWVQDTVSRDPEHFVKAAAVHEPHYLWIGCSDARVPANVVTGTAVGEMFVHRNIANQVLPTDPNVLAVLQYAVEVLKVKDIIVCGHEHCGGVNAALSDNAPPPHVHGWLGNLRMIARLYADELAAIDDPAERSVRLVELNVLEQVRQLSRTPVVQKAWDAGVELRLNGWVYKPQEGMLRDLGLVLASPADALIAHLPSSSRPGQPYTGRERRKVASLV